MYLKCVSYVSRLTCVSIVSSLATNLRITSATYLSRFSSSTSLLSGPNIYTLGTPDEAKSLKTAASVCTDTGIVSLSRSHTSLTAS